MPVLTRLDHTLAALIVAILPLWGACVLAIVVHKKKGEASGNLRLRVYLGTMAIAVALAGSTLLFWASQHRSWGDLGIAWKSSVVFWLVFGVLVAGMWPLVRWRALELAKAETIERVYKALASPGAGRLLPRRGREFPAFYALGISSAICEELLYRGYILWYARQAIPLWAAGIAVSVVFGLGHIYQGRQGVVGAAALGIVFAGLYAATGCLLLPVLLHALVNLHQAQAMQATVRRLPPLPD
jgi:membrane protease YdiL (CAAX protease family)